MIKGYWQYKIFIKNIPVWAITKKKKKKTGDWLLQPSLPLYDLDNGYGGSMGKQKDHLFLD